MSTLTSDQIAAMFLDRQPDKSQFWISVKQATWLKGTWDRELAATGWERIPRREADGEFWTLSVMPNGAGVLSRKP